MLEKYPRHQQSRAPPFQFPSIQYWSLQGIALQQLGEAECLVHSGFSVVLGDTDHLVLRQFQKLEKCQHEGLNATRVTHRNAVDDTLFTGALWDRGCPLKDCPADHYLCYLCIAPLGDVKEDRVDEKRLA